MSSVALIELHKSFEGPETETTETKTKAEAKPEQELEPETKPIPAAEQAQPSTPTVTSPTTPPAQLFVEDAPAVSELKAVHDIPSTPPAGKSKGSAPAKPAKK